MKIFKTVVFVLLLLVSLAYLFIIITPKIFEDFYPFGIKTAVVLTGSMEPTIEIDDFIIVKKPDKIEIDDIVSYKDSTHSKEVLHRVVKINGNEITTKGDANNVEDKPIDKSQITGVYIGKIKYLGNIISFITTPIGFSLYMTIFVAIMLIPSKKKS